jgi:hypothetical protein
LVLLLAGASLLLAAKLHTPALAAGSAPTSVLSAIVVLALACLGAPVRVSSVTFTAAPLGALLVAGAAMSLLSAREVQARGLAASAPLRRWLAGALIAPPLALYCAAAAALAQLEEPVRIAVDPVWAAVLAALWGCVFGGLGGLRSGRAPSSSTAERNNSAVRSEGLQPASATVARRAPEGVRAGLTMLAIALAGGVVAASIWAGLRVLGGLGGGGWGIADAVAGSVALLAFLPNLSVAAVGLSLGAPVEMGAFVSVGDAVRGASGSIGLLPLTAAPPYLWPLLTIPAIACYSGGAAARKRSRAGTSPLSVLAPAAVVFAGALSGLSALAGIRLSGLTGTTGASLAPHVGLTGCLALLWASGGGFLGWTRSAPGLSSDGEHRR